MNSATGLRRHGALAAALLACACAHRGGAARSELPTDPLSRAQQDLAAGRSEDAQRGFEAVLARAPASYPAIRGRTEAARRRGALPAVAADALARTQRSPADGLAWYALGLARFAAADQPGAIAALRESTQLLPADADPQFRLGVALFDSEQFAAARAPLERAVQLGPAVARYRVPFASCLDRLGDRKAAVAALAAVATLSPTLEEATLAVLASRAITDPFRGVPRDARESLEQALGYLLKDAPALAVPPLEELLGRMPDLGAAHALLGLAAVRMDEAGRAVTELTRAAELSPDAPQPHVYLAELYAAKDRNEQAAAEYALALQRDPLDVVTLRKLGQLQLDRLGRATAAVDPLSRAAALVSPEDDVQLLLARAELGAGRTDSGRARLEKIAERRPEDAEVLLRLAMSLYDQRAQLQPAQRKELAARIETLLGKVLALQPENAAASRMLTALRGG